MLNQIYISMSFTPTNPSYAFFSDRWINIKALSSKGSAYYNGRKGRGNWREYYKRDRGDQIYKNSAPFFIT